MTTTKEKERTEEKESKETTTKEEEKDITEEDIGKDGIHGIKEDQDTTTTTKDKEEEKEEEEKANATTQCHICEKFGHVAANCYCKDSTYPTAAVGSSTTGQTQHFSMDHPTNDQPVARTMHLRQLRASYYCTKGRYLKHCILHYDTRTSPEDISHVYCEEVDDYKHNVLEINYNQQLTNSMNPDYARELPAHYLKHWGPLVDTGAYVSVAPRHFAPEVLLEPVLHSVQLLTTTSTPIKIYGTKTVLLVSERLSFYVRFYITDVKQTLLGLQDTLQGDIQLNLRDTHTSTIQNGDVEELCSMTSTST